MIKVIHKWSIYAIFMIFFLLTATVLIIDTKIIHGVSVAKQFWFFTFLPVTGIIACMLTLRKSFYFAWNHITNLNMIVMTVVITGIYLSTNTHEVMKTGTLLLVITSYFYFLAFFQLNKTTDITFHFMLIALAFIEVIWGYCQLYAYLPSQNSRFGLTGSFNNPGPYAAFLAIIMPFSLYWTIRLIQKLRTIVRQKGRKGRTEADNEIATIVLLLFLSGSTLIGTITILPATMARSAWLAGMAGSSIVLFYLFKIKEKLQKIHKQHPKGYLILFISFILMLSIACYGIYRLKKDSADGRLLVWKISLSSLKEHPLTGVGIGNFPAAYGEAQANYFMQENSSPREKWLADIPEYGFNEFLQIAVEGGIIGIVLFLILLCSTLWYGLRNIRHNPHTVAPIAAFTAFGLVSFFSYPLSTLALAILFTLLLALCNTSQVQISSRGKLHPIFIYLLFLGINIGIIYPKYQTRQAYAQWAQAQKYYDMKIFATAAESYEALYPILKVYPDFLFEYGDALSKTGHLDKGNRILSEAARGMADPMIYNLIGKNYQAKKQFHRAEYYFLKAHYLVPNRLYPLFLLAHLYQEMELPEKAFQTAQQVINADVKINSTATKEIKFKMKQLAKNIQESSFLTGVSHQ
ncbi:O-antigen ligase family protein [Gabonibacter chumensis]|uniref:O-antigen ligase family protein n=1 Tax=Gabonibacter chumensis TaxID=2972474 RepID=UPI002573A477|nr:O-antigen ligase family protein [Gabonibacter chumensis]MCR9013343.1 O-antigen ligase family protein [Gabonibacter chumensis]